MSSLLVLVVCDQGGADRMIVDMQTLQHKHLISISDAATVIHKPDGKIKIKQASSLVGAGVLGGAFWGMLIGLTFFMPWIEMTLGAYKGALTGKLSDYGIDETFIKEVGITIRPGHSALFLLVASMTEDQVIATLTRHRATLLRTNLSHEAEAILRESFGDSELED